MRSRLPDNLNPSRYKSKMEVDYSEYRDRFYVKHNENEYLIDNKVPFTIYISEGFGGEEVYERSWLINILKAAEYIYDSTGKWPDIIDEWEEMCPGGLLKLDVSFLARVAKSNPTLIEILDLVSSHLSRSKNSPFSKAEKYYYKTLKALPAFHSSMGTFQREFDEDPLRIVNVNTKCRRLRYLAIVANFAERGSDIKMLANRVLKWAIENTEALGKYKDPRGAILVGAGERSVAPYIALSKELRLVVPAGKGIAVSNESRALILAESLSNNFALSIEERLYFLYELLRYDRDAILPILVLLRRGRAAKSELRSEFPKLYAAHISALRSHAGTARSRRMLDVALERVEKWKNPKSYMEHIIDPRISWLTDLNLCGVSDDKVVLTEGGEILAKALEYQLEDMAIPVTESFLRRHYFRYYAKSVMDSPTELKLAKMERSVSLLRFKECCDFVHSKTRSLAPNRIVASTLFRFIGIDFFRKYHVPADFQTLVDIFLKDETVSALSWQLRWVSSQDDGYLSRIHV